MTSAPQNAVLTCLSDGRARTVNEIARQASLAKQDVMDILHHIGSEQLRWDKQHRHEYVALRQAAGNKTSTSSCAQQFGPRSLGLRQARTCYGHFAGDFGIALTDYLLRENVVCLDEMGFRLRRLDTPLFLALGLTAFDLANVSKVDHKRCLDWAHRRPHIGGALGRLLVDRCEALGWIKRGINHARAVHLTTLGARQFEDCGMPVGDAPIA